MATIIGIVQSIVGLIGTIVHIADRFLVRRESSKKPVTAKIPEPMSEQLKKEIEWARWLLDQGLAKEALQNARNMLSDDRVRQDWRARLAALNIAEGACYALDDEVERRFYASRAAAVAGTHRRLASRAVGRASIRAQIDAARRLIECGYPLAEKRQNAKAAECHWLAIKLLVRSERFCKFSLRRLYRWREYRDLRVEARQLLRRATHNLGDSWLREVHDGTKDARDGQVQASIEQMLRWSLRLQREEGKTFGITYVDLLEFWVAASDSVAVIAVLEELINLSDSEVKGLELFDHIGRSQWIRDLPDDPEYAPYFDRLAEKTAVRRRRGWIRKSVSALSVFSVIALGPIGTGGLVHPNYLNEAENPVATDTQDLIADLLSLDGTDADLLQLGIGGTLPGEKQMNCVPEGFPGEPAEKQMVAAPNIRDVIFAEKQMRCYTGNAVAYS